MDGRIKISALLCLIVVCVMSAPIWAGEMTESSVTGHYVGTVGNDRVQVAIHKDLGGMCASCWYERGGGGGEFRVSFTEKATVLDELVGLGERGQKVLLTAEKGGTLRGTWKKPGKKALPVKLELVADYRTEAIQDRRVRVMVTYPVLPSDKPGYEQVNETLRQEATKSLKNFDEQSHDPAIPADREEVWLKENWQIQYLSADLLSVLCDTDCYYKGSIGSGGRNFIIRDGKPMELKMNDLFRPGYESKLTALILKDVKKQKAERNPTTRPDMVFARSEWRVEELRNFTIHADQIVFHFPPYTFGSFAEGGYDVSFPYSGIADLIDPNGPLGRFVKKEK